MPESKVFQGEFGKHLSARISTEEAEMLAEMLAFWFPGNTRVQGAVIGRAIRLLYEQFKRERAQAELYGARDREEQMYQNPMGTPLPDWQYPSSGMPRTQ